MTWVPYTYRHAHNQNHSPRPIGGPTTLSTHHSGRLNPGLWLCQEYAMLTGDYDDLARVLADPDRLPDGLGRMIARVTHTIDVTFDSMVRAVGLDTAVRAVTRCVWLGPDDFTSTEPVECGACLEVRHA